MAFGLVNAVVPVDELDAATGELDNAGGQSLAQALEAEGLAQALNANTEDMREAMAAFQRASAAPLHRPVAAQPAERQEVDMVGVGAGQSCRFGRLVGPPAR